MECPWGYPTPDVQMFGEIPGDKASFAYGDFFFLNPFLWKFLLFVSKSAFWRQESSSFILGVVRRSPVTLSSASPISLLFPRLQLGGEAPLGLPEVWLR